MEKFRQCVLFQGNERFINFIYPKKKLDYPKKHFLFFKLESEKILYYCSSALRIVGEPGILHDEGCS